MSDFLKDFHLPSLIVALILSYQLAIYFFYLYLKVRKEKIELNKLLLGFSLLYGFTVTGILFRNIYSYYMAEGPGKEVLNILSLILITIGGVGFLIIISLKSFNPIVDNRITKIMILFVILGGIIYLLIQELIIGHIVGLSIIGTASIYLAIVHKKFINISTGNIKKRLIYITIGQLIIYSYTIIYILMEFLQISNEILLVILIVTLIGGQAIILFGIYEFPAFLEFDWKKSLIKMYIINHKDYSELYSYEFINIPDEPGTAHSSIEKIFTRCLVGIDQIVSSITHTEDKRIKKIKQDDVHILLDYGQEPIPLIYALVVFNEMNSIKYFLRRVATKFDKFFKHILLDLDAIKGKEQQIFSTFNEKMIKILD